MVGVCISDCALMGTFTSSVIIPCTRESEMPRPSLRHSPACVLQPWPPTVFKARLDIQRLQGNLYPREPSTDSRIFHLLGNMSFDTRLLCPCWHWHGMSTKLHSVKKGTRERAKYETFQGGGVWRLIILERQGCAVGYNQRVY